MLCLWDVIQTKKPFFISYVNNIFLIQEAKKEDDEDEDNDETETTDRSEKKEKSQNKSELKWHILQSHHRLQDSYKFLGT